MKVLSLTTTRVQGPMRRAKALRRLLRRKHWAGLMATAEQVHGTRVAVVPKLTRSKTFAGMDGLLTAATDQPLGIFTADCLPVFLAAPKKGIVGLLHAGWRGARGKILSRAVRTLRRRCKVRPCEVMIWFGPAIGPCCFDVRWDVARYFPAARQRRRDRWTVDLARELRRQAAVLGVRVKGANPPCTKHRRGWFSYRRAGTADRQVSVILKTI